MEAFCFILLYFSIHFQEIGFLRLSKAIKVKTRILTYLRATILYVNLTLLYNLQTKTPYATTFTIFLTFLQIPLFIKFSSLKVFLHISEFLLYFCRWIKFSIKIEENRSAKKWKHYRQMRRTNQITCCSNRTHKILNKLFFRISNLLIYLLPIVL